MRDWTAHTAGQFLDSVLRGIGQVMLQDNALTGLLFLAGIFAASWAGGLYALLGTGIATGTASLLGAPREDIRHGLYGFNGTLMAVGLAIFLQPGAVALIYVVAASAFTTLVMAALTEMLASRASALTAPFVLTTWVFLGATYLFARVHGSPALAAPHVLAGTGAIAGLRPADFVAGTLNGVSQVFLLQNAWTGVLFLVGLAVNSRKACAAAVLASAIAAGIAWSLGASAGAIRTGVYGFNAVLTAIALAGVFFLVRRATLLIALLAVAVSTILYGTLVVVLSPLGLPAVTAPFVVTTWIFLFATGPLARLRALTPAAPAPPENAAAAARRTASEKHNP